MMETCWCQHHWHRYTEWKSSFFFKWKIPLEKDDRMTYSHLSSLVFDNKHTHKLVVALVRPSSLASPLLTTTTTRRRLVKYKTFTNQPREMVAGPIVSTDNRLTRQLLGNGRDAVDYFWQQHPPTIHAGLSTFLWRWTQRAHAGSIHKLLIASSERSKSRDTAVDQPSVRVTFF